MTRLRLGLRVADYAYAVDRLVRSAVGGLAARFGVGAGGGVPDGMGPGDEAGRLAPGRAAPVVLLPGIYETWRFLAPLASAVAAAGYEVHAVEALGVNHREVRDGARRVGTYLREADLTGVVLLAHSKGGLVGKAVMLSPEGRRVAGLVAVATPWRGSAWARLFPSFTAVGRLSPGNRVLRALGRERSVDARIVSLTPAWDPHIPGGSHLPGARTVPLRAEGHFRPLGTPEVRRAVLDAVAELAGS